MGKRGPKPKSNIQRFLDHVYIPEQSEYPPAFGSPGDPLNQSCWIWQGEKDKNGYGRFYYQISPKKFHTSAHKFSYALFKGVCSSTSIRHICHQNHCVNPSHLYPENPEVTLNKNKENNERIAKYLDPNEAMHIRLKMKGNSGSNGKKRKTDTDDTTRRKT